MRPTIPQRTVSRAADERHKKRVRVWLRPEARSHSADDARWTRRPAPSPDAGFELTPDSPLAADDQRYLTALLQAGSKAELARVTGVSRAAVTQRIQRIQERIRSLGPRERASHEAWMQQQASVILDAS